MRRSSAGPIRQRTVRISATWFVVIWGTAGYRPRRQSVARSIRPSGMLDVNPWNATSLEARQAVVRELRALAGRHAGRPGGRAFARAMLAAARLLELSAATPDDGNVAVAAE